MWHKGEATIEQLLQAGELSRVADGEVGESSWIATANKRLASAIAIRASDPESAFILTYEAVHAAGMGILARQGLRPTVKGGHVAIESALKAQFHPYFEAYGWMRRTRNQQMYPSFPGEVIESNTLDEAIEDAEEIIAAAEKLMSSLTLFIPSK